jgi:competence protein ComEA
MWKQFISGYLNFTKRERTGTLALLVLIAVLILLPFLFPFFIKKKNYEHDAFEKEIASLTIKQADTASKYHRKNYDEDQPQYARPSEKNYAGKEQWKGELFYFDPNTLDEAGWKKLGIRDKTIATIKNYVSKGGKFNKPDDIRKIWGLNDEEKGRLEPYIKIESAAKENLYPAKNYDKPATEKPKYTPSVIDINTADTTVFIALPGIGSKLSQRIVTFREKLGGFHSIEQVGETFGLPDSTFQKIKLRLIVSNPVVKQLNINTATLDELKSHPYIRYAIANAIVQYRVQHGNFSSLPDLKKIMTITEEVFTKAVPYLKIN